jgi:hypothetical protein
METQREWLNVVNAAFPRHWEEALLDKELPSLSSFPTVLRVSIDSVGPEPDEISRITLTVDVDGKQLLMSGRYQDPEEEADETQLVWEFADAPTPELKAFASEFTGLFCDLVDDPEGTRLQDWNTLPPG